jgi:hypothetical protein
MMMASVTSSGRSNSGSVILDFGGSNELALSRTQLAAPATLLCAVWFMFR